MPHMERPRTAEACNALPEGPAFGETQRLINGQMRRVPVAPELVAIYHGETDIISWQDANGEGWQIGPGAMRTGAGSSSAVHADSDG